MTRLIYLLSAAAGLVVGGVAMWVVIKKGDGC